VRRPLPKHLPRDEKVYAPAADACPACGGGLRPLGEDVAEQLEFVPASFRVILHVCPKRFRCNKEVSTRESAQCRSLKRPGNRTGLLRT
jgi:transposase